MMAGGKTKPRSPVTYINSASSEGSATVSFPATTAGDKGIMVANMAASVIASTAGWTRIISLLRGTVYAKTMSAGETSATLASGADQIFVAFFRGCAEPSTGEGTYSGSIVDPDCPVSVASAGVYDMVLAITAASYTAKSIAANVPSGYTEILFGSNGANTRTTAISYILRQSGTVNPPVFDWNLTSGTAGSSTIILAKS